MHYLLEGVDVFFFLCKFSFKLFHNDAKLSDVALAVGLLLFRNDLKLLQNIQQVEAGSKSAPE